MIEATELLGLHLSSDRKYLRLRIRDQAGGPVTVSLPTCWLNAMLTALPRSPGPDTVHSLDSWSIDRIGTGQDLVLTLRSPEAQAVSFAIKPWQVEGMATIAMYGNAGTTPPTTVH